MTKQDFELIATVLRDFKRHEDIGDEISVEGIASRLAIALQTTNPRFDRSRFIAACMGEDSTDSAGRKVRYSTDPHAGTRY